MPYSEAEAPYWSHRKYQDDDIEENIRDSGPKERGVIVDAFAVGIRPYPSGLDGYALEDVGEDDGDTPACDEGENDVAGILEGLADTEEAVVEE